MKRFIAFIFAFCILISGCKKPESVSMEEPEQKALPTEILLDAPVPEAKAPYALTPSDTIVVTGDTVLSEAEYSIGMRPEIFVLVKAGASVVLEDVSLDKVNDGSIEPSQSQHENAMLLGEDASTVTIKTSILSGESPYSPAVCLNGKNSSADISDSGLSVTGEGSDALYLLGGTANISDSTLISCGESGAAIHMDSGIISCKKTLVTTSDSEDAYAVNQNNGVLSATDSTFNGKILFDGDNEFTLHNSSITGTFFSGSDISSVILRLTEYSSLISGCDDSACGIQLFMDKTCSWELQSDMYLDSLTLEDSDFSIIKDNGYSIYYNSENMANTWLEGKTYALQNGGYLSPLI